MDIPQISQVTKGDFGYYHCVMQHANTSLHLIRVGLNVAGPFFTNTWDLYRPNFFQGVAAFLGFIVASALVLATHKYRWKEPESLDKICIPFGDSLDESTVGSGSAKPDPPGEGMIEYSDEQTTGDCKVQLESCPQSFQSDSNRGSGDGIGRRNSGFVSESQF